MSEVELINNFFKVLLGILSAQTLVTIFLLKVILSVNKKTGEITGQFPSIQQDIKDLKKESIELKEEIHKIKNPIVQLYKDQGATD